MKTSQPVTSNIDAAKLNEALQTIRALSLRAQQLAKEAERDGAPNLAFAYDMQATAFESSAEWIAAGLGVTATV